MPSDTIVRNKTYVLSEKLTVEKIAGARNKVRPLLLSVEEAKRLGLPSQKVFYKKIRDVENPANLALVLKYQIVAARLYRRLLGPDFAPEIRLVVGPDGKPKGIISSEMPNFKPVSEIIEEEVNKNLHPLKSKFPSNSEVEYRDLRMPHLFPEAVIHPLVRAGWVKLAVNYFTANRDGNSDNMGLTNKEGSSDNICNIDYDQALWPLVEGFYSDEEDTETIEYKAIKRFPLKRYYLGANFVNLPHDEYFAWFNKNSFSCKSLRDPEYVQTPALAYAVNTAPNYSDDQFFELLKIFFTPPEDIEEDISFLEDEEEETRCFSFLQKKESEWLQNCFENDEFCKWLIDNKENLEQQLLDSFKNDYPDAILQDRLKSIKAKYSEFLKLVELEFTEESPDHSFDDINNSSTDSQEYTSLSDSEEKSQEIKKVEAGEQNPTNPKHGTSPFILMCPPTLPKDQDMPQSTFIPSLECH